MTYTSGEKAFLAYSHLLTQLGRADLPLAVRGTLNKAAFESRKHLSEVEMPKAFTLRNRFENKQSLHYERVPGGEFNIGNMKSSIGQMRVVRFQRGPKRTSDLFRQEVGGSLIRRPGSKLRRVPTDDARAGGVDNRPVLKKYRPTGGRPWLKMRDVERNMGILKPRRFRDGTRQLPLESRISRVHAIMMKNRGIAKGAIYVLPLLNDTQTMGVFTIKGKAITLLHTLHKEPVKLTPRKTVQPTMAAITPKVGEFFVEQADHRVKKAVMNILG